MYGWAGIILRVDLSTQRVEKEPFTEELGKGFIGGRGVNSFLLYQEVKPNVEPFSPENRVIIGCGPLSGSLAPSTPRCTITAKSPLTGILGDANFGGYFGPEMKFAGCDHIVIQGKTEKPVYLWIEEGEVEFRSAEHLWGKTTGIRRSQSRRSWVTPMFR